MVGRVYGQEPAKNLTDVAMESKQIFEIVGLMDKAVILAKDLKLMQRKWMELVRALAVKP
jgi:ABC-type branched-subunit amino acid transport system ATPase component